MSTKKKTYKEIKNITENKGFTLLSDSYVNSKQKLSFNCNIHGEFSTTFKIFQMGHGCPKCAREKTSKKFLSSRQDLKKIANNNNLELVDFNETSKEVILRCHKHGILKKHLKTFLVRGACFKCGRDSCANKRRTTSLELESSVNRIGLKLISTEFSNIKDKIILECPTHGKIIKNVGTTLKGYGCIKCAQEKRGDKRRRSLEEIHSFIINKGYKPLFTEYKSTKQKILLECSIHGEFYSTAEILQMGSGCQKCGKTYSKSQGEVTDFTKSLGLEIVENTRKIIPPLELDIYIPELNLAIEYCGLRWHSEQFREDKKYHHSKMKLCNDQGIRLITIFEDEWLERQDQVKGFLSSVFQKNKTTIYARKCEIKEVPKKDSKQFLDNYHIQGATTFKISFGLYYENELVGIITGNKHHRQGHENMFVLNRLAFKGGISVTGGSSKLLKSLTKYAKAKGYSKIISWSDNRWSEGNVYKKLGFSLEEELGPDYSYVLKQKRFNKQSCQKKNLVKKGAIGATELEMAVSLGYSRIWDCGKKRWILDLTQSNT